jgi:hypothetical protein
MISLCCHDVYDASCFSAISWHIAVAVSTAASAVASVAVAGVPNTTGVSPVAGDISDAGSLLMPLLFLA